MRTRWDELAAPFDRLAAALGVGDRALVETLARRAGWGARPITAPLLPSGVRHGVPWGLSVALVAGAPAELRVFLEAQADPPGPAAYLAAGEALLAGLVAPARAAALGPAQRLWHAVGFARDRGPRFHAYACVPDHPERAWAALARAGHDAAALRAALPARARVTIASADLAAPWRTKLYALVPDAALAELPALPAGTTDFARALLGRADTRLGWLVSYGFTPGAAAPTSVALHFSAAVHGDAGLPARLAGYCAALALTDYPRARAALGEPPLHFVSYQQAGGAPRVTVYFLPEVQR